MKKQNDDSPLPIAQEYNFITPIPPPHLHQEPLQIGDDVAGLPESCRGVARPRRPAPRAPPSCQQARAVCPVGPPPPA